MINGLSKPILSIRTTKKVVNRNVTVCDKFNYICICFQMYRTHMYFFNLLKNNFYITWRWNDIYIISNYFKYLILCHNSNKYKILYAWLTRLEFALTIIKYCMTINTNKLCIIQFSEKFINFLVTPPLRQGRAFWSTQPTAGA